MSRNSLLESGAKSEGEVTATGLEPRTNCNIINNDYQQGSRALHTFVRNKPFRSLLEVSPTSHIFLKTFNSEFQTIEVWFTD